VEHSNLAGVVAEARRSLRTPPSEAVPFATRLREATTTLQHLAERYSGDVEWLAEGYLGRGELVIVPGPPESYKSWLMADLVRAVHVPGALWLGSLPVIHGTAVYFEQERAGNLVYQTQRLARGWSQNLDALLTVGPCGIDLCDPDCAKAISAFLEEHKPVLAVFNSYKAIFRGRTADSADVSRALQWLGTVAERLRITVAVVDGDNKPGALGRVRGMEAHADSIQKEYEADAVLHVERRRDEVGRGTGAASVYVGKRRQGDAGPPFLFDVQRQDDHGERVRAVWLDETSIARSSQPPPSNRAHVLDAMPQAAPTTVSAIVERTGLAESTVSGHLRALEHDGLIHRPRWGAWQRGPGANAEDAIPYRDVANSAFATDAENAELATSANSASGRLANAEDAESYRDVANSAFASEDREDPW
jgi:DNA-binding transcriptional ArsR family regulator